MMREPEFNLVSRGRVPGCVSDLAWSPDGKRLAVSCVDGEICLADNWEDELALRQFGEHGFGTSSISWNADGRLLASTGQDGKVKIWDTTTKKIAAQMDAGANWGEHVRWHHSGRWLASAAGKSLRIWDVAGALLYENNDHTSTITDLQWKPGADVVAVTSYGGVTCHAMGAKPRQFKWQGSSLVLRWSPDARFIATGDQDSSVHFWYADSGKDSKMWGFPTKVRELSWHHSSKLLATGGGESSAVWDCSGKGPENKEPVILEAHGENITLLAFQHAGDFLLSGAADEKLILWLPGRTPHPLVAEDLDSVPLRAEWDKTDGQFVAGMEDGSVAVYRLD